VIDIQQNLVYTANLLAYLARLDNFDVKHYTLNTRLPCKLVVERSLSEPQHVSIIGTVEVKWPLSQPSHVTVAGTIQSQSRSLNGPIGKGGRKAAIATTSTVHLHNERIGNVALGPAMMPARVRDGEFHDVAACRSLRSDWLFCKNFWMPIGACRNLLLHRTVQNF